MLTSTILGCPIYNVPLNTILITIMAPIIRIFLARPQGAAESDASLLGGSWDLVSKVISTLIGDISSYK